MNAPTPTQSAAVAEIALSLPEDLNTRALLAALARAYSAGFEQGFAQGTNHVALTVATFDKLLEPRT